MPYYIGDLKRDPILENYPYNTLQTLTYLPGMYTPSEAFPEPLPLWVGIL